jgi:hypothetical protein
VRSEPGRSPACSSTAAPFARASSTSVVSASTWWPQVEGVDARPRSQPPRHPPGRPVRGGLPGLARDPQQRPGRQHLPRRQVGGRDRQTPFSGNLKPGKPTVWISADGYDETEHKIEIIAGETHEIAASLSGTPVGYLDIRGSGLDGARVYVDRELVCERAPCRKPIKEGTRTIAVARDGYKTYRTRIDIQARTELSIKPSLRKKPSRTDAVVAYIFAAAIAGGATYAFMYSNDLEMGDKNFDQKDNIKYGAFGGWGLAGVVGLSAVYYTFRDKGPPSTGTIDVRAVALEPTVGPGYGGVSLGGRF